jgi:adenosylcobinamide amidohydrolase
MLVVKRSMVYLLRWAQEARTNAHMIHWRIRSEYDVTCHDSTG